MQSIPTKAWKLQTLWCTTFTRLRSVTTLILLKGVLFARSSRLIQTAKRMVTLAVLRIRSMVGFVTSYGVIWIGFKRLWINVLGRTFCLEFQSTVLVAKGSFRGGTKHGRFMLHQAEGQQFGQTAEVYLAALVAEVLL